MSENVTILNSSSFDEAISSSDKPILVDFYADWCGPCRSLAPILEEIASENDTVTIAKLDVDQNQEIATRFNVRTIPTMILFQGGEAKDTLVGAMSKEDLLAKLPV